MAFTLAHKEFRYVFCKDKNLMIIDDLNPEGNLDSMKCFSNQNSFIKEWHVKESGKTVMH